MVDDEKRILYLKFPDVFRGRRKTNQWHEMGLWFFNPLEPDAH